MPLPSATFSVRPWWLLPVGRVHPAWWLGIAALMIGLDYGTGLFFRVPVLFIIPVSMAAWYSGGPAAVALAIVLPVSSTWFGTLNGHPAALVETAARVGVQMFLALVFTRFAEHERIRDRKIRVLEGLLPICAVCKSIRDSKGQWQRLEHFIQERSDAKFSHGLCPQCVVEYDKDPLLAKAARVSD